MITADQLSSIDDLDRLREEWCALLSRCPDATPFQHPGWLIPWWRYFGSGDLLTLAIRVDGQLVALAPMFLHDWAGRRQITLLGTGTSDYLDIVADPRHASEAMRCVYDCLQRQRDRWDTCDWQDLLSGSAIMRTLPAEFSVEESKSEPCVAVPLPEGTPADWFAALPHGLRRNLRRYRQHLETRGTVECTRCDSDPDGALLRALFDLHTQRWQHKGGEGVLGSESLYYFHREVCQELGIAGLLRFYIIRMADRIVAIIYGYCFRNTFYSYLGGFDPELTPFSPGSLILHYGISQAMEERVRRWDFLRGEERYKFDWGGVSVPKHRVLLQALSQSR